MICKNCNAEMQDGVKFCTNCGNKVENEIESLSSGASVAVLEKTTVDVKTKKKTDKKKIFSIVGVFLVLSIITTLAIIIGEKSKIKPIEDALNAKSGIQLYYAFEEYLRSGYDLAKCDELFAREIQEMSNSLYNYDFTFDAKQCGSEAIEIYLKNNFGSLLLPEEEDSPAFCILGCIELAGYDYFSESYSDLDELEDWISGAENYCQALQDESNEDYLSAYRNYQYAFQSSYMGIYTDWSATIESCITNYLNSLNDEADTLISSGDYEAAIEIFENGKEALESNGYVESESSEEAKTQLDYAIDDVMHTHAAEYAEMAEEYFNDNDIDAAIGHIEVALEFDSENADYQAKLETYKTYKPFPLYLEENYLEYQENDDFWGMLNFDVSRISNNNQNFEHCIEWYNNNSTNACGSVIYNLDGKYDAVKGKFFLCENSKNRKFPSYIEIYGDGKLLFTSSKMQAGVLPEEINVNVAGVHKLKVCFYAIGNGKSIMTQNSDCAISNFVAYKGVSVGNSEN